MKPGYIRACAILAMLCSIVITGCGQKTDQADVMLAVQQFLPQSNELQGFERASIQCYTTTPDTAPYQRIMQSYSVQGLCRAEYIGQAGADITVAIYDMGSVANSFGAWSMLDKPGKKRAGDGLNGCISDFCLEFYRAQYVVCLKITGNDPAQANAVLRQFGSWIDSKIGEPAQQPPLIAHLPKGYIEGSLKYFVNAESLNTIYDLGGDDPLMLAKGAAGVVAGYSQDTVNSDAGSSVVARDLVFVVEYPAGDTVNLARRAFEQYIEYYNTLEDGYSIVGLFNEPIRIMIHRDGKLDSVVYQTGNYIFGAWHLRDETRRRSVIKTLIHNLQAEASTS